MPLIKPRYKRHQNVATNTATTPYFTIKDLATIYEFPAPNPSFTSVIGIVSFGGGLYGVPQGQATPYVLPANAVNCDVQKYWNYMGYKPAQMPTVIVYPVGGAVNNLSDTGSTCENTLDVSVIGGCYPSPTLTIVLFIFPDTYAFSQALPIVLSGITFNNKKYIPSVISISWGLAENYFLPGYTEELTRVNNILKTATQNGVNICVAAGDNGSTDGTSGLSVDFPASSPYVTALGGTSLVCPNKVYDGATTETVWNGGLLNGVYAATGGGVSAYFSKPTWQTVGTGNYRNVPDVAFNSDPATGLILYLNGQLQSGWGGTSMAAPMFAAYVALIKPPGFINPLLYGAPANMCFHDITKGNNNNSIVANAYSAGKGYDCCTGLGSINGRTLKNAIIPAPAPTPTPPKPPAPAPTPPKPPAPPKPVLVSSLSINPPIIRVTVNNFSQCKVFVKPTNASKKTVVWSTSNPNIVLVNGNGMIMGRKRGVALIRATSTDGSNKYAYTTVVVQAVPVKKKSIYKGKIFTHNLLTTF
jgi:kumamolisin